MATLLDFRMPDEMLAELARIQQVRAGGAGQRRDPEVPSPGEGRGSGLPVARIATLAEFDEALGETLSPRGASWEDPSENQRVPSEPLEDLPTSAEPELEPAAVVPRSAAGRITDELATLDPVELDGSQPPPFAVPAVGPSPEPPPEDAFASAPSGAEALEEPIDLGAFATKAGTSGAGRSPQRVNIDGLDTVDLPSDEDLDGGDAGDEAQAAPRGFDQPGSPDDDLSGLDDDLSGLDDDLSGLDDDLSGPDDDLSGPDDDLSGPDDDLSGPDDDLSGPDDDLSGLDDEAAAAGHDQSTARAEAIGDDQRGAGRPTGALPPHDDPGVTQPGLALSDIARRIREEARRTSEAQGGQPVDRWEAVPASVPPETHSSSEAQRAPASDAPVEVRSGADSAVRDEPPESDSDPTSATPGSEAPSGPDAATFSGAVAASVGRPTLPDGLILPQVIEAGAHARGASRHGDVGDVPTVAPDDLAFDLAEIGEATGSADELLESMDASFDDILDPPEPQELIDGGSEPSFEELLDPGHALTIPPESVEEPADDREAPLAREGARAARTPRLETPLRAALNTLSPPDERPLAPPRPAGLVAESSDATGDAPRAPRPPPIPSAGARYVLRLVSLGAGEGRLVELTGEPQVIGTAGSLRIDDAYASEHHARVAIEGARMRVDDLDSLNGVWLRLRAGRRLQTGDSFLAGRQIFRVIQESEASARLAVGGVERLGARVSSSGYRIQVLGADDSVHHDLRLHPDGCRIGRHLADLVFTDDDQLSATHAVVRPEGTGIRIDDLGSRNGTWVRARGHLDLGVGDTFMTGRTIWRVSQPAR